MTWEKRGGEGKKWRKVQYEEERKENGTKYKKTPVSKKGVVQLNVSTVIQDYTICHAHSQQGLGSWKQLLSCSQGSGFHDQQLLLAGKKKKHLTGPTVSQRTALARASRPEMVVDRTKNKNKSSSKRLNSN